jgi:toxin-antitoxin system PIN domain toxin
VILTDVNILVYAFRSDSQNHARFREWLESVVNGPAAYAVSPQVLCSFIRVATHPRIFIRPSRLEDALAFARVLQEQPRAMLVTPGENHWTIFENLCRDSATTGNLVQDAWFAALAIESGCEWITADRDYARFKGLRWRTPF